MSKLFMYRNSQYPIYNIPKDCITIYMKDVGIYISYDNTVTKILQKPTFELNEDTIDSYMESREFEKVLESEPLFTTWFNGYDDPLKKAAIIKSAKEIREIINFKTRTEFSTAHNLHHIYAALSLVG